MTTNSVLHLLVYISGHGYGHVAQTAPVLNQLCQQIPDLRLTVVSSVPRAHLQSRIHGKFEHIDEAADFGMTMASALDVLPHDSLQDYQEFHRGWAGKVSSEARRIATLRPDFVLSNIAYLPLAATKLAGIPCAAMCSLNWMDIFAHYCAGMSGAEEILGQMYEAYAAADSFLRITPGMAMDGLDNKLVIGPIARVGKNRRPEIDQHLGLAEKDRLVLVSMGGIASRSPLASWPVLEGVRWLVSCDWHVPRADVSTLEALGMDFADILHSCDALVCKPGYGSFAEAACNGVPVLYVSRHDWPEEPCLVAWLEQHGRCQEITRPDFESGALAEALPDLWNHPGPVAAMPDGIRQATDYLLRSISIASP